MVERQLVGQSAVERALGLARQNAATAAIALTLVPLAAMPSHATVAATPTATITATSGGTPGNYTLSYTVTNTNPGFVASSLTGASIIEIEIPEIHLGDIVFASGGSGGAGGVFGWTATETATQQLSGSGLYSGTPAGYIDLATSGSSGDPITPDSSETFVANVKTNLTTSAAFEVEFSPSGTTTIDPPIPQTAPVAVPEPSSFAALGTALLGLLWFRRRKA